MTTFYSRMLDRFFPREPAETPETQVVEAPIKLRTPPSDISEAVARIVATPSVVESVVLGSTVVWEELANREVSATTPSDNGNGTVVVIWEELYSTIVSQTPNGGNGVVVWEELYSTDVLVNEGVPGNGGVAVWEELASATIEAEVGVAGAAWEEMTSAIVTVTPTGGEPPNGNGEEPPGKVNWQLWLGIGLIGLAVILVIVAVARRR